MPLPSSSPSSSFQKVRLVEAPRLRPPREVQLALEALSGMPLHIVYVGQGREDPPRVVEEPNDKYDCSRRVYDFPAQADAVLLLCYVTCLEAALQIVKGFKKLSYSPPVLPLLLRSDGAAFENMQINSVSAKLTRAGADDVMVQPRNKLDLPDMLQTTLALVDVHWEVEKHLLEQIDDRANTLFFNSVDRIIQGFPKLNDSVQEIAPSRSNLGGVGRHIFVNVIGTGKFGKVYQTRSASMMQGGSQCASTDCEAVKVISKRTIRTPKHANQVMKECRLLQKVSGHPNIAEFRGLVHARSNLYIFMEYVGTMDLVAFIRAGEHGRLESARVLELLLQILDAVAYCHMSLVAHRDIKSENVVLTSEAIPKLVDFGLSVSLSSPSEPQELCGDMCGTIPFAPPEVYRGKKFDPEAMDVWSLGILTLEMRCGNNCVCRMLGCVGMTEPTAELADVFERFFCVPDWPQLMKNAHGIGMAPELLAVVRCSLVVKPEKRWRAGDLWQHIANSSGADRFTAPRGTGRDESDSLARCDMDHVTSEGGSVESRLAVSSEEMLSEHAMWHRPEELSLDGDVLPSRRYYKSSTGRANFRRLRP
jgi:serine/threonine protein kinase